MRGRKLASAKMRCEQRILSKYTQIEQLNILRMGDGHTQEDLDKMNIFIDSVLAKYRKYKRLLKESQRPESVDITYDELAP